MNKSTNEVVGSVLELRDSINTSHYKDIFSFEIYNKWVKKQVSTPLSQILKLLEKNKSILEQTEKEIETQIQETKKVELQSVLELQLKRVVIQKRDIEKHIPMLETALEKLQS